MVVLAGITPSPRFQRRTTFSSGRVDWVEESEISNVPDQKGTSRERLEVSGPHVCFESEPRGGQTAALNELDARLEANTRLLVDPADAI
jgi:hypothetical protein